MKHIIRRSLIGQTIEIVEATSHSLIGLKGRVVDESKHMLTIETTKGKKRVIKEQVTMLIAGKRIPGALIAKRIEDRIKG